MRRRVLVAGLGLGLVGLVGSMTLRSPSTPDIDGPRAVSALETIELLGRRHRVLLRGADDRNPVLLFLHGGPGAAAMPFVHGSQSRLEARFVVVHWDRPGAGASCGFGPAEGRAETEAAALALIDHLRARFEEDKVLLVGHSWGTALGARLAARAPERVHAFVGLGQVAHRLRHERLGWDWLRGQLEEGSDDRAWLMAHPPPYRSAEVLLRQRRLLLHAGGVIADPLTRLRLGLRFAVAPEYSLREKLGYRDCLAASFEPLDEPEVDLFEEIPRLEVPAFVIQGGVDWNTATEVAREWVEALAAPRKAFFEIPGTAHAPHLEAPEQVQDILLNEIWPAVLEVASSTSA